MTTNNFWFYLQNRLIQNSQTGGQLYSDTSPFSIPCTDTRTHWSQFQVTIVTIWLPFYTEVLITTVKKVCSAGPDSQPKDSVTKIWTNNESNLVTVIDIEYVTWCCIHNTSFSS